MEALSEKVATQPSGRGLILSSGGVGGASLAEGRAGKAGTNE